jgi:hypothetical protein
MYTKRVVDLVEGDLVDMEPFCVQHLKDNNTPESPDNDWFRYEFACVDSVAIEPEMFGTVVVHFTNAPSWGFKLDATIEVIETDEIGE